MSVIGSQIGQFMERKEVERAVLKSEARKGAILRAAIDAIVTIDHQGVIHKKWLGGPKNEVLDKEVEKLVLAAEKDK